MMIQTLSNQLLNEIARRFGTPAYVYDLDHIRARAKSLRQSLGGHFKISYAMKANPNAALLAKMREIVDRLDVSSAGEITRDRSGMAAGAVRIHRPGKARR